MALTGLAPDTTYLFEVESTDGSGNTAIDDNGGDDHYTFTTVPASDTTPPVISDVQATGISATSVTITWTTDEDSTSVVNYGTNPALLNTEADTSLVTTHSVALTGLAPDTIYYFEVESTDGSGNTVKDNDDGIYYTFTTFPAADTTAPIIQNVEAIPEVYGATIVWQTDEPSTSKVEYGGTGPPFVQAVEESPLTTTHSLYIADLEAETTYHFRINSTDEVGNTAIYPETGALSFTTEAPASTTLRFTSNSRSTETSTVEIDRTYTTWVEFLENENGGNPIDGATIEIIDSEGAVSRKNIQSEGSGVYRVELTPAILGHFSFKITASNEVFDSASGTLILDILPIETDLYFVSNYQAKELAPIQINEMYTTLVQFNRTSTTPETPINDATLSVTSSDPGISSTIVPLGNGIFNISVWANESRQVSIVIEASKAQYKSDSVTLVLISGLIETRLRFNSTLQSTETGTIQVYKIYTTWVQFYATAFSHELPIDEEGTIEVQSSNPDLAYTWDYTGNGFYQIELEPTTTGQINIDLEASTGPSYLQASASLTLIVEPLPTKLRLKDPSIVDNRLNLIYPELKINVLYTDESNEGLNFEHFEWEAEGLDFQIWIEGEGVGEYIFSFEASAPGTYPLILTLYKPNYANASLTTVIVANPIPVANILDTVNVIGGTDSKKLTIELRNEVDDTPITGATVTYSLVGSDISGVMEDLGNGIYVADLSGEKLYEGNYTFEIVVEKANHASLVIEYSLIMQEPASFLNKYWMVLSVGGCLILGSTTRYIVKEHKKRRVRTLLEAKKRITLEYLTDIAHFEDLLVITSNGVPFYSFTESISPKGIDPALYSSFLLALNAFAEESLGQVNMEDHIRFGKSEIFLHSIRELIFVYIFSAQPKIEDWKEVSHGVLKRCRELTIQIEHDFHDIIREFEKFKRARIVPKLLIMDVITKVLGLDFVFPHLIKNLKIHSEIGLKDENSIIKTIEQLGSKEEIVSIFQVLEWLKSSEIPSDDIIFTFHKLRKEGVIIPLGRREQEAWKPLSILEESLNETKTIPIDLEESMSILAESLQETKTIPIDLEENLSILAESLQETSTMLINNPKDMLSLLEKLRPILINSKYFL